MKLKTINAVLGLLSILLLMFHMGYVLFSYITFYYNPILKLAFAVPFMVVACLHAVCGMLTVFTQADGTRMDLYPKQNIRTILQRVSAALIFPLLILHINTFSLLKTCSENNRKFFIILLILAELLFFATVITHVVVSLSKGLITLGLLSSVKIQKTLDMICYVIGAILFVCCAYFVVKVQVGMFLLA